MNRYFTAFLQRWLRSSSRLPLVIRGARQVGKTWLVRDFAEREGRVLLEVNLERDPRLARHFAEPDPRRVFDDLSLTLDVRAAPGGAILFVDEIQNAPEVLARLRWFAEELPELAVVAAGSLLEFALRDFTHSMPVGRIQYAHVEPLTFAEFLAAHGQHALQDRLAQYRPGAPLADAVHQLAASWYERFAMAGGMPAVVALDAAGAHADECRARQRDLIQTYRDDFAKYSGRLDYRLLDTVLLAATASLGNKLVYSRVGDGVKSVHVKRAVELLAMARLCHLIPHSAANGVPLAAEANERIRKVALLDVGLAHGLWNTPAARRFPRWEELPPQMRGGLTEQLAAQQLRTATGTPAMMGQVHHWRREGASSAEIDYLVEVDGRIVPVEIKSGAAGAMKSMHQFMYEKALPVAVRLDRNPPSLQEIDVKTTQGQRVRYRLLNLPHYLAGLLPPLLRDLPQ
ncbi:MAG: AAA family ATPase [Spirochaetaceae bacterium]|nr:AAA family ATPase [Spirochaetaceae bacterium]